MYEIKPISEIQPACRLIEDEKPPIGKDVWLISKYGHGYRGRWDRTDDSIVAWAPLPKLTEAQREYIHKIYNL
jgi:hypothetical protein